MPRMRALLLVVLVAITSCGRDGAKGTSEGVDTSSGCGGVTDRATADAIEKLRGDFQRAQCKSGIQCGAWTCAPKCTAGRCTNR